MSISETVEEALVKLPNGNTLTREEFSERFHMDVTEALEREHAREELPELYTFSDGESYTPSQVAYLLEGIAASPFLKKKDGQVVRRIQKALQQEAPLSGEQLSTTNRLLSEIAHLEADRLDGAVIHPCYNNGSRRPIERVIRTTLSLLGDHQVMGSDVQAMYTRFFDRSTRTLRPEVEARLPAGYNNAVRDLTNFFQELTPAHKIVAVGYAVPNDTAPR